MSPNMAPNTAVSQSDVEGVGHLKVASLLGLLVQAMIWIGVAIIYLIFQALTNATTVVGVTPTIPAWITVNTLYASIGLLAGGFVLGIVSYIFFYLGFRAVKRGAPDFGAPTALVMVGLIGFLMAALGIVIVIGSFVSAINSPGSSFGLGAIFAGIALLGLGGLLALIGVIGLILGNWRAGKRYDQGTIKIGAIVTILPFVSIVGYILLLVGYMQAGKKLQSGWVPVGMGMGAMPMPGYGTPPPMPGYGAPPPAGAPAPGAAPTCPKCGQPATWVAQYGRWYCSTDQQYL